MDWRVAEYRDYKKSHGLGDWDSGVLTAGLKSWDEFGTEIARLLDLGDFIWRGQRHDWSLISKFDRIVKANRDKILERHKDAFLLAIRGRRGSNPPPLTTDEEKWSLGQHYGLPTPLLDWTQSPFVAAYFAFRKKTEQVPESPDEIPQANEAQERALSRFVYGLSEDVVRWGPAKDEESPPYGHFVEFVGTLSDENARLLSQRGFFTKSLSPETPIEQTVRRCYAADTEKGISRIILVKIKIPDTERDKCLRNLNTMNINHATLFPDLTGAAEYCSMKLEIENYG
jgi:hypothetical protein